jgi:hypothetical protein
MSPTSVETVEYYPYLVKGYQGTYLRRRLLVIPVADARDFKDAGNYGHQPSEGHPAVGVTLDRGGGVLQRLYGPDLVGLVQNAIARSAQEAGMISSTSNLPLEQALHAPGYDYVLATTITRCWVTKRRRASNGAGPEWSTNADAALQVAIYKPPFTVPFWQGISDSRYDDPPLSSGGGLPEDETEIYDHPGQVLSVALTRAVAGIFRHEDLHTLVYQDTISAH